MKLTSINREGSNQTTTRSESYKYDADRGYLDAASTNGGSSFRTWEYDAAGNRTSDSGNTGTWTYDSLNRMIASPGHTYSHDVLGNRTWRDNGLTTAQKYRWDELNRMTATYNHTTGAQYMYRPDGMPQDHLALIGYSV